MDSYSLQYYLSVYNRRIRHKINHALRPLGLNESNFFYLTVLDDNPGLSQSELAEEIKREQSIVTRNLNKLVAAGWIAKKQSAKDRRKSRLFITVKTREKLPEVKAAVRQAVLKCEDNLSAAETDQLILLLRKAANLN